MTDLRAFPRFADLTREDADILFRVMVAETFEPGHVFVREGERASGVTAAMYVILEGEVRVAAARPVGGFGVERTLGAGEIFGHVALAADVRRSATVTAATRVRTLRLDRRTFDELQRGHLGVYARFQLVIARQLAADARALQALLARFVAGARRRRASPASSDRGGSGVGNGACWCWSFHIGSITTPVRTRIERRPAAARTRPGPCTTPNRASTCDTSAGRPA